jgi:hypothetical protein
MGHRTGTVFRAVSAAGAAHSGSALLGVGPLEQPDLDRVKQPDLDEKSEQMMNTV